ncbi:OmpP1/FadL family transporter [Pontibacter pudoricolor]|uniref:OmpP1/FadL family transporter n=1 Tax=Pontibacter pudoricolor TaxID=2694930 RepID=UPI0013911A32|nr:hypothetical protein [Pontibacter pudoricolor]
MNKLFSASLALLLGWSGTALAQNEEDALRYTRLGLQGSARIQGIGGAQTALGADISTISVNPAGLGMFRRSEANLSLGFTNNSTNSLFAGRNTPDNRSTINIPQAGVVFSNRKDDNESGDWRGSTFGISMSRINNFNNRSSYNGTVQPPNTIVDYFAEQAILNGRTEADLDNEYDRGITSLEGLAYGAFLINFEDIYGNTVLDANPLFSEGDIDQIEELERRGSQNQIDLAFGTSFRDKVYLGASIGIVSSKFTQERIFRESGYFIERLRKIDEETDEIVSDGTYNLELRDEFTTEGAGVNLKIGVIVRPIDALRFGLSIQTPTAYTLNETYTRSLYSTIDTDFGKDNYSAVELPGEFSYNLTTPFRANGGVAVFLGKYGFITADAEFVDYSNMRFSEDEDGGGFGSYFSGVNSRINDTYKSAMNYRIGAEGRYEVFRLRAGYAISESPYKNSSFDAKINTFTLGAGVRLQNYYADIAYARSNGNSRYSPYTFDNGEGSPIIDQENEQSNVMFTVGLNF